jgi:phosphoenolpyruvate-protein phosphotransferase
LSATLTLLAPFPGWCMPLGEVPDEVFAQGLAGDGVAVDPTAGSLCAPCDGEMLPMKDARHAVTLRSASGIEVLIHVGIDTVGLRGEGFMLRVKAGDRVRAGQELLRFDLDLIARRAPSLVSPIVLPAGGTIVSRVTGRAVKVGEALMEVAAEAAASAASSGPEMRRDLVMAFDHGLHVRPAAQVVAALKPFKAEVTLVLRGRSASARSTVAMMSLGALRGDVVQAIARGADAGEALAALEALLPPHEGESGEDARTPRAAEPLPPFLEGVVASRGLAIGPVAHWMQAEMRVPEQGAGEAGEQAALARAVGQVRERLEALAQKAHGEERALLRAHAELAADPELQSQAGDWLRRGKSAAFAWRQSARAVAASLARLEDVRMRERAADLRDLETQVLRVLAGGEPSTGPAFPRGCILIAEDLPPSALLGAEPGTIGGICTAAGGPTSHVAILAAAAGIPALVAVGPRLLEIAEGTRVVLDAEGGCVELDPAPARLAEWQRKAAQRDQERRDDDVSAQAPALTRDAVRVSVLANLGSVDEVAGALRCGAEGCGLLRTEFLFLERAQAPTEEEQAAEYQRIASALGERPLTIRTLDPGGDKPLAYLPLPREENPALGMRGVRASLWKPELLKVQLRAIARVEPAAQVRVLVPMVTDAGELVAVRTLLQECAREVGSLAPRLGAMIETPASALLADTLAREADFLSIGSNDLSQYALAMDRGHPELARRLDALHPAVLRLIALVASAGELHGKPVSLCGALGSDAEALPILLGLGVHEVSAAPSAIPRLKRIARELDVRRCRDKARRALEMGSAAEVRAMAAALLAEEITVPVAAGGRQ